jgi:ectoine hydroxylase-related dioxygenase (phytanoyl-CoA dioxygenase family)
MRHAPQEWRRAYENDGFAIVAGLLDAAILSQLRDNLDSISATSVPPSLREKVFLERDHVKNNPQWYAGLLSPQDCGDAIRQIADLPLFSASFAELILYPAVLDVLEVLLASSEFSFHSMIARPKAARVGNGISNGNFHRDTPFEDFTSCDTIQVILCLDDMTGTNGGTAIIRGSHQVADEEAAKPCWREVEAEQLDISKRVVACCPAGSGVFFTSKVLHAAGHNRSEQPRRTIFMEWLGPDALPTSPVRHAYQGLKPRSKDALYQRQIRQTFPHLFGGETIA